MNLVTRLELLERSNKKDGRRDGICGREKVFGVAPDADDELRVKNVDLLTPLRNSTTQTELLEKGQTRNSTGEQRTADEKRSVGLPQNQTTSFA